MKKSLQIFALLFCIIVFAQAPEKFSYQAVIRNSSNALITNANVGMKISILKTSAAGTVVYSESQTAMTNINGLVSIQIGAGTPITGTIAAINWGADSYYIKTETDPAGGTNYTIAGTTQLLSVPYALYTNSSASDTPFIHFSSFGGSSQSISIGSSTSVINTWTGLEETGGVNYNGTTGEYTIPVTGYYRISTQISFENSNTQNGNQSYAVILVDNLPLKAGFGDQAVIGQYYSDSSIMVEKKLTMGQKVKVAVAQDGRPVNTLYAPATSFSINLLHK